MLKSYWLDSENTVRDPHLMLTLFRSLLLSRLDYASQLWSPYLLKQIYLIKKVQRASTKHITGICDLSYSKLITKKKKDISIHSGSLLLYHYRMGSIHSVSNYSPPVASPSCRSMHTGKAIGEGNSEIKPHSPSYGSNSLIAL